MNKERTAAAAAVMLAFADGQTIQTRAKAGTDDLVQHHSWRDLHQLAEPLWCWHTHDFRIKPHTVTSRRYLARGVGGMYWVSIANELSPADPDKQKCFVRWIDAGWVETEI